MYMLKRHCQYRQVAEKIFFKLVGSFRRDAGITALLKKHANQAISEL